MSSNIFCSRLLDSTRKLSQVSRTGYYTRTLKAFMSLYFITTMSQPGLNLMGNSGNLMEILDMPRALFQNSIYWCYCLTNSWFIMTWKSQRSHISTLRSQSLMTGVHDVEPLPGFGISSMNTPASGVSSTTHSLSFRTSGKVQSKALLPMMCSRISGTMTTS